MRIFKFWVESSQQLDIKGKKQKSKIFGGSNLSVEDAKRRFKILSLSNINCLEQL